MSQQLTNNKWGFSVEHDNPFLIFPFLQGVARKSVGDANMIDLSRGDPGYGFTPSVRGRRFYSYLVLLDTHLNNETSRFVKFERGEIDEIMNIIREFTGAQYAAGLADELLGDLEEFAEKVVYMASGCGLKWDAFDVLFNTFRNCALSGGMYLDPRGEEIVRIVLADWYGKLLPVNVNHDDLILTYGASHSIGTLFKALGAAGINYLNEDSTVLICSPVYSPYNASLLNRGIQSFVLSVNPLSGDIVEESFEHLEKFEGKLRAIILIDPNNPTGYTLSEKSLQRIAGVAKKHNSLIITDEVYASFFPKKKMILDYCPERTIRIDARSKVERSTGLRFGDMFISKEANEYITNNILVDYLNSGMDFKDYLLHAKGPGGSEGELQHTTFVPGPSQFMGMAHMVLAEEERKKYFESVYINVKVFVDGLGLPHKGNLYYVIFDMNSLSGSAKKDVPVEEKLLDLAKLGVVYLPACLFFSEYERMEDDLSNMVRASVVNTSTENVGKAAEITKKYLTS